MFTIENTPGFTPDELNEMNLEVRELINKEIDDIIDPSFSPSQEDFEVFEEYWEKKVLEKRRGD